jgi:hypothetical protein
LVVSEQFRCSIDHHTDEWNCNLCRVVWAILADNPRRYRDYSRILGNGYSIYCLLGIMLSSSSTKAVPVSYTRTSVGAQNLNILAGFGGDGLLYGLLGGSNPARLNLITNTLTLLSTDSPLLADECPPAVSANNIMFLAALIPPTYANIGFLYVGPYTGAPASLTTLFTIPSNVTINSIAVNATGTILYVHYNNSTIASYTGWNGTTATATVISSSVDANVYRIARAPSGTFYMTNRGGIVVGGGGSTVNFTMTPAGVISSMASSVNICGTIAIDADGLPVIPGGSGGTAYITKVGTSTATILNGVSIDNITSTSTMALNPVSRIIYVYTFTPSVPAGTLFIYTPVY